jgi:hypothetical protein
MPDRDELFAFEKKLDEQIARSNVFKLPLRSVLTNLYGVIDILIQGRRFGQGISRRQTEGEALSSRLSYLTPLLKNCTSQIGVSAINAFSPTAQYVEEFKELVSYAHLCELMPEVHRGYYEVRKTSEGFELIHPSKQFAKAEEYDILLTELSLAFLTGKVPDLSQEFIKLAARLPNLDLFSMCKVLVELFKYHLDNIREVPLLEPSDFQTSIGVGWDEFLRVRAALFAYVDYSISLADALEFLWNKENNAVRKKALFSEFYEWISVCNTKSFFIGLLMALTGVKDSAIEDILIFFAIDVENQDFANAGEGFFPPFAEYSDSYLFSPYVLRLMLTTRNILYVINKRNPSHFNNVISHHLEPILLRQALELLRKLPGLRVISNQNWVNGEFDLLVYQPTSNTVLHVQAKAPIPPQGARMTRAVENRSKEGIEQLNRFQNLPQDKRDSVLSEVLKMPVKEARCVSVLLCRTGLGTYSVWESVSDITVLNLQLLNGVVQTLVSSGLPLSEFKTVTDKLLTDVHSKSVVGWEKGSIALNGILIQIPLLRLNQDEMYKIRKQLSP